LVAALAEPAAATDPAIARPRYTIGSKEHFGGTAFFFESREHGVIAVAAAHSFPLHKLGRAEELEFISGGLRSVLARSTRVLSQPGLAFNASGGNVRDDLILFVLDGEPIGARSLEPGAPLSEGERVSVLGIPSRIAQDEDDLFGTVALAAPDRIEIDLDIGADLRGWGGAPILRIGDGKVVGVLQAAWPTGATLRVSAAPIVGVVDSAAKALEGGSGASFAAIAGDAPTVATLAGGANALKPDWEEVEGLQELVAKLAVPAPAEQEFHLDLEYPEPEAIVGDSGGVFVAGQALAPVGEYRKIDVMFVLDTSGSTADASGSDVNGNGVVGRRGGGPLGGIFGNFDAGDSILAAEVASARNLIEEFDPRSIRVGLVTFAGETRGGPYGPQHYNTAVSHVPLTIEYDEFRKGLDDVIRKGPSGGTHMAAGVDQATRELLGLKGSLSVPEEEAEHVVIFLTDGIPTLPYSSGARRENNQAVLRAAKRAASKGIRVFTYGIGPKALDEPVAIVELAEVTGGQFTPVRDPSNLVQAVENVNFGEIESLVVRNLTTGTPASDIDVQPNGRFSALVPMAVGKNVIRVSARANDGREAELDRLVHYAPDVESPPVPADLVASHNRLLEKRLLELKQGRESLEEQRAAAARRELVVEIERERERSIERAKQQRRELELEIERQTAPREDAPQEPASP
jgi:Mg-chelatase subunit ChlD